MNRHFITTSKKWLWGSLLSLILITTLYTAQESAAHPLPGDALQPTFNEVTHTSPAGEVTILSQEITLAAADLADNGERTGFIPLPEGLGLAETEVEGSYTSAIIHSPLAFTTDIVPLWGVDLPESASLRLETRLSVDGGNSWSDWVENPEAFYPVRDDLHSGNLIWVGSEQVAVQVRMTLRHDGVGDLAIFRHLTLVFNDTSQGPTDGDIAGQIAGVSAAEVNTCPASKPAVVSRTQWGCPDGQHSPRRSPTYAPVTHIIIHQSETPNGTYPYQDYAGWVRSIWNFHANVLWWGDVGYNYLIDPNGMIYEGRAGGDDVIGIHDGHNVGSLAIGFIGCYGDCDDPWLSSAEPSPDMLDSAVRLMSWKSAQQDIDPLSSAPYAGLNNIPVIAGGRDVAWTSSPGSNLYNRLPDLRQSVAEAAMCNNPQACQITSVLFDKESYDVGEPIDLTVRLADHEGDPLPGAQVAITDVSVSALAAQASTGFGLIDRVGEYQGSYTQTEMPGLYEFTVTADDPTGEQFLTCTATASVPVHGTTSTSTPTPTITPTVPISTPTPTPTITPTPTDMTPTLTPTVTATPSPTPTTQPTGAIVKIAPENLVVPLCTIQTTTSVKVENVANLVAIDVQLRYDPTIIQVIDADPDREGVQVKAGPAFTGSFIAQNSVDPVNGRISFAATRLGGNTINGSADLITVDWQPQAAGTSALTFDNVILANPSSQVIEFTPQQGAIEVTAGCAGISGKLTLQGRTDHSGVLVANASGQQTYTQADGSFSINDSDSLNFAFPGYLSARAEVRVGLKLGQVGAAAGLQPVNLGTITLLAGDVNGDNVIDILDLAAIATYYGTSDPTTDLNGDARVDIFDLALAAKNYRQRGPLTNWQ